MISTPLLNKHNVEHLKLPTQIHSLENSPVKHALIHVAQTAAETLKHAYSAPVKCSNYTQTVLIRAIEPEYKHLIFIERSLADAFRQSQSLSRVLTQRT